MIALSSPQDKTVRAQVAETISLIASNDFPERWPDLIDVSSWDVGLLELDDRVLRLWSGLGLVFV